MTQPLALVNKSFVKYPKIHRLGADENVGILDAPGPKYVQEKIDGANVSVWCSVDPADLTSTVQMASRNQLLHPGSDFNGFCEYVHAHPGIAPCVVQDPTRRLFGEWLVKHTVQYEPVSYRHFYLFDILVDDTIWLDISDVYKIAATYDIKTPQLFMAGETLTSEQISAVVGQSALGAVGEGVVIKAPAFRNKFGESAAAKVVSAAFKEDHSLTFKTNHKVAENYEEMKLVNTFITPARVAKVVQKLESLLERPLADRDTERVINTVYHDFITEECWGIAKLKKTINFKTLSHLSLKLSASIYLGLLAGPQPQNHATPHHAAGDPSGDTNASQTPTASA